jgi:hypothetical protein
MELVVIGVAVAAFMGNYIYKITYCCLIHDIFVKRFFSHFLFLGRKNLSNITRSGQAAAKVFMKEASKPPRNVKAPTSSCNLFPFFFFFVCFVNYSPSF